MSMMNLSDFKMRLESLHVPVAYDHFKTSKAPPCIVFRYPSSHNVFADGQVFFKIDKLDVEIYTELKDPAFEEKIECILDEFDLCYDKTETYIQSEGLYEVLYEMEVLIGAKSNK